MEEAALTTPHPNRPEWARRLAGGEVAGPDGRFLSQVRVQVGAKQKLFADKHKSQDYAFLLEH